MSNLNKDELFVAIENIAKNNLLDKDEVKNLIKESIVRAFHSKFDPDAEIEINIDEAKGKFEVINKTKFVVDDKNFEEKNRPIETPLSEAKKKNPNVKDGDIVSGELELKLFERPIAIQIKQMLTQSVKEKKKEAIFAKHKSLKGEMIDVIVSSVSPSFVIFTLDDGTTAFMPGNLRNPNVRLSVGQKTQVYVEDVLQESRDAQIIVSNGSKAVIKRVLESEVPEVAQGIVEIVSISRMPGVRSKVSVRTSEPNVDPVGAIIGANGQRIQAINQKLEGEKLDIIAYSSDINTYVANALSPAKIASIVEKVSEDGETKKGHVIAIAPNSQQTLAIGKMGSNVRLAVELTNTRIDVLSIDQANEKGISWTFNVGMTPSDLEAVEAGQRMKITRNSSIDSSPRLDKFDNDIESFNSSIEEDSETPDADIDFEIDEDLFSEEDLQSMQEDFEFDEEIDDFVGDEDFE